VDRSGALDQRPVGSGVGAAPAVLIVDSHV
jgi:hypothetical protein